MDTEYSKDMIAFAEDVADMMAKRRGSCGMYFRPTYAQLRLECF